MQTFIIGRDAGNQIVINDKLISRHHAQLSFLDNGQVTIKDLGSSNGTFVNGNRVNEAYLNSGDILKCGTVFVNWDQYVPRNQNSNENIDLVGVANKAQVMNNQLVSFIKPFLETIDSGSFFRKVFYWIYFIIAILNILLPFYILFVAIDKGFFNAEGKYVLIFLFTWLIFAALCFFGFQLWWNRKEKVNLSSYSSAEFVATPVLAHLIQTIGEWYGVIIGVMGFLVGFFSLFFSDRNDMSYHQYRQMDEYFSPIPFLLETNWKLIFLGPLYGFLIVFLFRFISEAIKALSVIANNTKNNK